MIVVSHRGPFLFTIAPDGTLEANRGPGGLAGTLHALATSSSALAGACCVAAALSDGDRAVAQGAATPPLSTNVRFVEIDPAIHALHYEVVANQILWSLFHGLFDLVRMPTFDASFTPAWNAYVEVNQAFADVVVENARRDDVVLVQDYPLALVPGMIRSERPDLNVSYFTHTPFCGPSAIHVLPEHLARAISGSIASAPAGFHTERWARAYTSSVREVLGRDVSRDAWFVAPLGPDIRALERLRASDAVVAAGHEIDELVGDRKVIFRSDRIDPAKNIVRGFVAYDQLLEQRPEWRARVTFLAMLTPSRETLAEYVTYHKEVVETINSVNERWATETWQPIVLDTRDDLERTIAGFTRYDVLFVNSLADGLNLVAKEGPLVNARDGVLCLSPETGAFEELHEAALGVHPWDVSQTADALHRALSMRPAERAARAARLRALSVVHTPQTWLDALVSHAR